jgi:signal transduction protein with GAF and PtsI domain
MDFMTTAPLAQPSEEAPYIEFLHEIGSRMAAAESFQSILQRVLEFISDLMRCDSCFVYILRDRQLILSASKNPHPDLLNQLGITIGQGITGWVAENCQTVAIPCSAATDPRFRIFHDLPEDSFEAFLSVPILCRGHVVGVINLQHRNPHHHTQREIRVITTIGYLVGAELTLARIESEKLEMQRRLETRRLMERAKGILQRQMNIDEENAYLRMQKLCRQRRKPMREIAEAIILNEELRTTT